MIRSGIRNQWWSCSRASRGQISWICRTDALQRSRQTEVCLADMQEDRPASYYHSLAVKWPVTQWATTRRVDWRINWCCVFVARPIGRFLLFWLLGYLKYCLWNAVLCLAYSALYECWCTTLSLVSSVYEIVYEKFNHGCHETIVQACFK